MFEAVADQRVGSRRPLMIGGLLVIGLVGATLWFGLNRLTTNTMGDGVNSASGMAARIGCGSTYRDAPSPGSSLSAGSCTFRGAAVDLRVYRTPGEARAWLDGAKGQSGDPGTAGWGGVGGNWAVRVTRTRDAATVNEILVAVQRG